MIFGKRSPFGLFLLLVLMISVCFSGCGDTASAEITQPAPTVASMETTSPRKDLQTILVMGLDKNERSDMLEGYVNKTQSDFLFLLVIDPENHSISTAISATCL